MCGFVLGVACVATDWLGYFVLSVVCGFVFCGEEVEESVVQSALCAAWFAPYEKSRVSLYVCL